MTLRKPATLIGGALLGAAGILLSSQPVSAEGGPGAVILDPDWTIQIRPAPRTTVSPGPAAHASQAEIIPAVYQEPGPTPELVAPAASGEKSAPIGPQLPPIAIPPAVAAPAATPRMTYAEAYAAVPFSRTEYEANPVYRHQAALELMFGALRPMTLNQQYTPRAFRYPDFYQYPYAHSGTQNIDIHQWGGGYNWGGFNGASPFGYPYGLRGNW